MRVIFQLLARYVAPVHLSLAVACTTTEKYTPGLFPRDLFRCLQVTCI